MKMNSSILSISFGTLTTILAKVNGVGIIETVLLAFIGGIAGYLGKIAVECVIKKIKKLLK